MNAAMPPGWGFAPVRDAAPAPAPVVKPPRSYGNPRKVSKCARIAYWLGRIGYVPSPQEIQKRWHVSRATAYRYHRFAQGDGEAELYSTTHVD